MKITIKTDLEKAKNQLQKIKELKQHLPSEKMYFRYPKNTDIDTDFASLEFQQKIQDIRNAFAEIEFDLDGEFRAIISEYNGNDLEINCFIVSLGTYGYFNEANEIYVNIWDASVNHILETITHEALHLILIKQTKDMTYQKTEQYIDGMFNRHGLKKLFPAYKQQF